MTILLAAFQSRFQIIHVFAVAVVIMVGVASSSAQTFRGTILGTVTDPNGAVVPDANVTAKNVATGIERTTVTDGFGKHAR